MRKKLKVMIVDDSPMVLEHLRFTLERAGHTVMTRGSALGTVQQVVKERPEVLVLDVSMPALDGDRLATVISELDRKIVIILHSSTPEPELRRLAEASGAHGFIVKSADGGRFLTEFNGIVVAETPASANSAPRTLRRATPRERPYAAVQGPPPTATPLTKK